MVRINLSYDDDDRLKLIICAIEEIVLYTVIYTNEKKKKPSESFDISWICFFVLVTQYICTRIHFARDLFNPNVRKLCVCVRIWVCIFGMNTL